MGGGADSREGSGRAIRVSMGSGSLEGRGRAIPRPDGGGVGERPAGQSWVDPGARLAGGSSPGRTEPEKPVGCRFMRSVSGRRCARPGRCSQLNRITSWHKAEIPCVGRTRQILWLLGSPTQCTATVVCGKVGMLPGLMQSQGRPLEAVVRAARFQDDRKIRPAHMPGEGPRTGNAAPRGFPV